MDSVHICPPHWAMNSHRSEPGFDHLYDPRAQNRAWLRMNTLLCVAELVIELLAQTVKRDHCYPQTMLFPVAPALKQVLTQSPITEPICSVQNTKAPCSKAFDRSRLFM